MIRRTLLIAAVLGGLLAPASAHATDYIVNVTTDTSTCTQPGTCGLRGALNQAAQFTGPDRIILDATAYHVSNGTRLTVPGDVTIIGKGANKTTILEDSGKSGTMFIAGAPTTIQDLTIANGSALTSADNRGGNVFVTSFASLLLDHVRITGGKAAFGGGIGTRGGGTVDIRHSLIDNNQAQFVGQSGGNGGGILTGSSDPTQTLFVSDTTIVANKALNGAGVMLSENNGSSTSLNRVTIADNGSTNSRGGGILNSNGGTVTVTGSLVARNTGNVGSAAVVIAPSNCSGPVTPGNGNVESLTDCGFTKGLQNTTAGLAAGLVDTGGQTQVLTIPPDSVARDFAGACTGTDQRDVPRPQGTACDSGAFEYQAPPPPQATATPTPTPTAVATASPTPTPTATPAPTPVALKLVVVKPEGTVRVKIPPSTKYVDLPAGAPIPVGATIDTRKGKVEITAIPKPGAAPETATFYDGIFKLTQKGGYTILTLTEQLAPCPKGASAAAKKPKTRRLWGSGKGHFRTSGRLSSATVRGTVWLVQDSCAGTLTRVKQGSVTVRDFVRKRNIVVRAGKSYTARQKRR